MPKTIDVTTWIYLKAVDGSVVIQLPTSMTIDIDFAKGIEINISKAEPYELRNLAHSFDYFSKWLTEIADRSDNPTD